MAAQSQTRGMQHTHETRRPFDIMSWAIFGRYAFLNRDLHFVTQQVICVRG